MPSLFTEDTYEQAIIELFENMGYEHLYAPDLDRDYTSPLLDAVLQASLVRINRGLPAEAIDEAISKLRNFDTGSLVQKNAIFMDYLQNGITVKFFVKGEERSSIVRLIDYMNVDHNTFYAVNQFTYIENGNNRRPDIILFINGLPLVLMELKSPSKDEVGAENAYHQIRNYMQDIPSMFYYNAICVISDLSTNKAGTITSGLDRTCLEHPLEHTAHEHGGALDGFNQDVAVEAVADHHVHRAQRHIPGFHVAGEVN